MSGILVARKAHVSSHFRNISTWTRTCRESSCTRSRPGITTRSTTRSCRRSSTTHSRRCSKGSSGPSPRINNTRTGTNIVRTLTVLTKSAARRASVTAQQRDTELTVASGLSARAAAGARHLPPKVGEKPTISISGFLPRSGSSPFGSVFSVCVCSRREAFFADRRTARSASSFE